MVKRQHRLDQCGGACGSLGVSDLGLDGADRAPRRIAAPAAPEHIRQSLQFGEIARDGPRPVRLDQFDRVGVVARRRIGALQRKRLTLRARRINALRPSVRRRAEAAQHTVDLIAVPFGVFETPQRQHPDAFAKNGSIRVGGERPTVAAWRERGRARETDEHEYVVERVDAAGDHQVRLPEP